MPGKNKLLVSTPEFWDEQALLKEEHRQLDVCHSCRLCWNFCPAFPALFEKIDATPDQDVRKLSRQDLRPIEALCYQCKLCYLRCPYITPHQYDLDVPLLFLRGNIVAKRKEGLSLGEKLLADTDRTFKMGSMTAPLANLGNSMAPIRFVLEKMVGIDRHATLPKFQSRTFVSWWGKHGTALNQPNAPNVAERKVAFFYTCNANYWDPEAAIAGVQVLAHNGAQIVVPQQQCCGMPYMDAGAADLTLKKAHANIRALAQVIRQGYDVVTPGPSCSLMLKQEYPQLLPGEESKLVAERTFDLCQYLWKLKDAGALKTAFKNPVGKVAYHAPCHIRAQFIGLRAADLIRLVPGAEVEAIEKCSHHDGTWGIKKKSMKLSLEYGEKLFQAMKETEAQVFVSDCPLAANQIQHATGKRPVHPAQVLKAAYGIA